MTVDGVESVVVLPNGRAVELREPTDDNRAIRELNPLVLDTLGVCVAFLDVVSRRIWSVASKCFHIIPLFLYRT